MTNWWVLLDYSDSSGPFLTMNFEFDQDHGPRPGHELDNHSLQLKTAQLELDSKVQLYSMTDQNKQLVCYELNKGHCGSFSLTELKNKRRSPI